MFSAEPFLRCTNIALEAESVMRCRQVLGVWGMCAGRRLKYIAALLCPSTLLVILATHFTGDIIIPEQI